jgi:hypothetical protein
MNLIFAGIILAIFVYSGIDSPEKNIHPVKCIHEELLGSACPTCGMSHGFSAIIRGRIDDAMAYQKNSLPVFMFFLLQLIFRAVAISLILKSRISLKIIINTDVTISFLLLIFTFKNMLFQSIYILYKMLLIGYVG